MAGHGKHVSHPRKSPAHRSSPWYGPGLLIAVATFYGLIILIYIGYHRWISAVHLDAVKSSYYHYEFIELRLRTRNTALLSQWRAAPPRVRVFRSGRPVATIAGILDVPMIWNEAQGVFLGRWPCPWNAPAGEYVPELDGQPDIEDRLKVRPFRIEYRRPKPLPRRFVALTMESVASLNGMKVRAPDGSERGWRGLLDWAQYMEADAFWILAGQTPGDKPGQTWVSYNLPVLPKLAEEAHRRGLKFGVWAMCYLTMSKTRLPRYQYAMDVSNGKPVYTRAISLNDPNRPGDIAELLKSFRDVPGLDFLGVDYIRNALGGYELVGDFVAEMPGVHPPPEWAKLTRDERMVWLARKKIMRRDMAFIDAWQWWRAHRAALIVRRIKESLGDSKYLWAFTLTWDKGWHHGQDPVMMNDAGIDVDSLMLYEATAPQFEWMMKDWHAYVHRRDAQLIVGDVVDWPLHQRSPRGPKEFSYRLLRAGQDIYQDGPAAGLFVHDLARALWGRLGPYSTIEWMQTARAAARQFRSLPDRSKGAESRPEIPAGPEAKPAPPVEKVRETVEPPESGGRNAGSAPDPTGETLEPLR